MTEVISDAYDITHQSPVSLEKLSAIAISLEIWRREVNKYREGHLLESFDPHSSRIPLKTVLPELPSAVHNIIYKYVKKFWFSVNSWLSDHYDKSIFGSYYSHRMNVLKDFDDFVCDYDGSIHYVRTAKRMVRCDKIDDAMKFNVACTYFLENDIRRMWPFVSNSINIDSIKINEYPQMYYWICRLTDKLDTIILTDGNVTIDEEMLNQHIPCNMSSVEYFWNGVSRQNQIRTACQVYITDMKTFIRIVLPKLDDQLLNELVNPYGWSLMCQLLKQYESMDEELILGTWLHIRNMMKVLDFQFVVGVMLANQYRKIKDYDKDNAENQDEHDAEVVVGYRNKYTYLCCEIWNNSPPHMKSSLIRDWLIDTWCLEHEFEDDDGYIEPTHINVELLLLILRSASFEARSSFWRNFWHRLIAVSRAEELQRIMELCFETREHEMAEFKQMMARSDNLRRCCIELFRKGEYFDHLNELASFIWPEMHNVRDFKQQIIRECSILRRHDRLEPWIVRFAEKLNDFIISAYNDVDLSADFKNRLMPKIRNGLWDLIRKQRVSAEQIIKFIDMFVSAEEIVVQIKMSIVDSFKKYVNAITAGRRRQDIVDKPYFTSILLWCLGSTEEVYQFKLTIPTIRVS